MPSDRALTDATPGESPSHGDVQQLVEAERGDGVQGVLRTWLASDSDRVVLISDASGVRISPNNGVTPPAGVMVVGASAGGVLSGTYPSPGFAPAPTFTGSVQINGALGVTGQSTLQGLQAAATTVTTLTATGLTTLQGLSAQATTVTTLTASTSATVTTLIVTNSATAGTLTVAGLTTLATLDVNGDLHLAGSATLGNAAGDQVHIPGTLLVVNEAEFQGDINHTGAFLGLFNTAPTTKKTVTGSRGSNAALTSLLTALANYGLITNSSST